MKFRHTHRNGYLIGILDFLSMGLLLLCWMPRGLQQEIEEAAGKKYESYGRAYLKGIPTLFIYTLIWMARIAEDLKDRAIELGVPGPYTSHKHMFYWNTLGLLLTGPAIATSRFFSTLDRIEEKLNRRR